MNISYEGIGHVSVTFPAISCHEGGVCKLNAEGYVTACGVGDIFCGVAEKVKNGRAAVQLHGFAKVKYTGAAPTPGYVKLNANGLGGVKPDSNGASYLVVSVNTADNTAIIEL